MREIFTSGTVGGALGNRCFYPEIHTFAMIEVDLHYLILYPIKPAHTAHLTFSLVTHDWNFISQNMT